MDGDCGLGTGGLRFEGSGLEALDVPGFTPELLDVGKWGRGALWEEIVALLPLALRVPGQQLVRKLLNIFTHGMPCHTCFQEGLGGKTKNKKRDWRQHC